MALPYCKNRKYSSAKSYESNKSFALSRAMKLDSIVIMSWTNYVVEPNHRNIAETATLIGSGSATPRFAALG